MTNTLNARNTPAMPEVWIPSAGIDAFVMHCATLAGAKAATFGLRWAYVKFLAALITLLVLAALQTTCGAANVSRLCNDIQDHVNTGFIRVYVFHH